MGSSRSRRILTSRAASWSSRSVVTPSSSRNGRTFRNSRSGSFQKTIRASSSWKMRSRASLICLVSIDVSTPVEARSRDARHQPGWGAARPGRLSLPGLIGREAGPDHAPRR